MAPGQPVKNVMSYLFIYKHFGYTRFPPLIFHLEDGTHVPLKLNFNGYLEILVSYAFLKLELEMFQCIQVKGSLTVWALYAYFSDSQNADFELLVWCM